MVGWIKDEWWLDQRLGWKNWCMKINRWENGWRLTDGSQINWRRRKRVWEMDRSYCWIGSKNLQKIQSILSSFHTYANLEYILHTFEDWNWTLLNIFCQEYVYMSYVRQVTCWEHRFHCWWSLWLLCCWLCWLVLWSPETYPWPGLSNTGSHKLEIQQAGGFTIDRVINSY